MALYESIGLPYHEAVEQGIKDEEYDLEYFVKDEFEKIMDNPFNYPKFETAIVNFYYQSSHSSGEFDNRNVRNVPTSNFLFVIEAYMERAGVNPIQYKYFSSKTLLSLYKVFYKLYETLGDPTPRDYNRILDRCFSLIDAKIERTCVNKMMRSLVLCLRLYAMDTSKEFFIKTTKDNLVRLINAIQLLDCGFRMNNNINHGVASSLTDDFYKRIDFSNDLHLKQEEEERLYYQSLERAPMKRRRDNDEDGNEYNSNKRRHF